MMAQKPKINRNVKPIFTKGKSPRSTASGQKAAKRKKSATPNKMPETARQALAPRIRRAAMREQLEKLEQDNAMLVAQSEEMSEAAKAAAARIAELEDQVAQLERQLAAQRADAGENRAASPAKGRRRTHYHEIDPGDSVPPGVAVEEPVAPDPEVENARVNLERHLGRTS